MQPIYTPFTCISEKVAGRIHDLLGQFILYQPGGLPVSSGLCSLADRKIIKICDPDGIKEQDVLASLKNDYHLWAKSKSDGSRIDTGAFMAASPSIPFYDENSSARIRTEINQLRRGESVEPQKDVMLAARLFLALAQDYDIQKVEMNEGLDDVVRMETDLMAELKGEMDEAKELFQPVVSAIQDPGGYLTPKRIESWSTLFINNQIFPDLFVTDSKAVVDELCDTSNEVIAVLDSDTPLQLDEDFDSHYSFLNYIINFLVKDQAPLASIKKWSEKKENSKPIQFNGANWSIYMAQGVSPHIFWGRYAAIDTAKSVYESEDSHILNTLIFLLEA